MYKKKKKRTSKIKTCTNPSPKGSTPHSNRSCEEGNLAKKTEKIKRKGKKKKEQAQSKPAHPLVKKAPLAVAL